MVVWNAFFFSPWQILGVYVMLSQLHTHSLADPQCLSLPFPQTSHSWAVPETSTETQALPDGAAIKQAQSFPLADLLSGQGVRWEGLHSWREQLKKPTALSMHTQWNVYRTSLDLFPWYLHMPVPRLILPAGCNFFSTICCLSPILP